MVEKRTLARPYAKAVFEIANKTRSYDKWSSVLELLSFIVSDNKVALFLKDHSVTLDDTIRFFVEVTMGQLDESAKNFISILAAKRRLEVLPEVKELFGEMRAEAEKTATVQFFSGTPLEESQKERFKKTLENYLSRTVTMQCEVDKRLLGGFVARAGNYVIDGSVRGFLTNLKVAMGE